MKKYATWFDGLKEPKRFVVFICFMLGWIVPLVLSDFIRPHSDIIGVALAIIGAVWIFIVGIVTLERSFGHIRK